jgi:signal transduction histidine kinase
VLLSIGEGLHRWVWSRKEQERMAIRERLLEAERVGLQRMRAVVEHVGDAIVSVDAAQRIRWMNPAAESLFRRRARTAVNHLVSELVPRFEAKGDVLTGEAKVGDASIPVEATATPMQVGGESYTNFVFRDVAARKATERHKDEFIAGINHELRTPLTSILGSLKLVSAGAVGPLPEKAKELLEIAQKNGELLLSLVSDLLDTAKIAAGRLVLQTRPVSVATLMEDAHARLSGFGLRHEVTLELMPLPPELEHASVDIDKERVIQVIGNLVSNAVKHSPARGRVGLTAVPGNKPSNVRIAVIDQGPGIPEEFHDQIFERFTMTVAGDGMRRPGTGLGLAIARGIVEAHRGDIGFETEIGRGTAFWFELPCLR